MDHHLKEFFGSWIEAIGTVFSALGSTPLRGIEQEFLNNLNLWGNVLQATGNALVADAQEITLEKIGSELQAIGNIIVIAAIVIEFNEDTKQVLHIKGNWLQALGGGAALAHELENSKTTNQAFSIIGNGLEIAGNSLQALGKIYERKKRDGQLLEVNGSWIQAVGSVILAIGQTKEELRGFSKP